LPPFFFLFAYHHCHHCHAVSGRPAGVDRVEIRDGRLWLISQGYYALALTLRPNGPAMVWRLLCVDVLVEDLAGLNAAEARTTMVQAREGRLLVRVWLGCPLCCSLSCVHACSIALEAPGIYQAHS